MRQIYTRRIAMSLITGCLLALQVDVSGQTSHPLTAVLKKISKIYGTRFVYEEDLLDKYEVVYEVEKGGDVEELLKKILYPKGLVFLYVKKNYYAIVSDRNRSIEGAFLVIDSAHAAPGSLYPAAQLQDTSRLVTALPRVGKRVTGQVTDRKGKAIGSASVMVWGTKTATATNEVGFYSLDGVPQNVAVLVFSCVGYQLDAVTISRETVVNMTLKESSSDLEQVVVIGYGEKKKEDLTAAISTIGTKELNEDHSSVAVSDMLAGRLSGLYVQKTGGAPGSGSDLKVRGLSTFQNSNPLIVVDGIPDRTLDELNATDIEAVSVLKDAASIAVYGARAANGVILITTKKGNAGKTEITFNNNLIRQSPHFSL